jgi:hypothetical protein
MPIEIVPYVPEMIDAVRAFNTRMRDAGSHWGWYEDPHPDWVPKKPGQKTWREYWLAVEDKKDVRGAYALKPHEWWLRGEARLVTDWQGPVSEGAVSRQYNTLGLRLLRDMLKKHPLLYSWGHGGYNEPMVQMLRSLKWLLHDTPFILRVLKPARFLRLNKYLRNKDLNKLLFDIAAFTGLGTLGIHALHRAIEMRASPLPSLELFTRAEAEVVSTFGPWADELWEKAKHSYTAIACRDAATMNVLVPKNGWPAGIRLRVVKAGRTIGWVVVMDTNLAGDARFGDLRVGSVVDALAEPRDAAEVIGAAYRFLKERGSDLILSNQSHPEWIAGFEANGFFVLQNKRIFAVSPELAKVLDPFDVTKSGVFLTNMDGHGPHAL